LENQGFDTIENFDNYNPTGYLDGNSFGFLDNDFDDDLDNDFGDFSNELNNFIDNDILLNKNNSKSIFFDNNFE
jgi:hypothetical protein